MEGNRREFVLGALTAVVLCWAPGIVMAQDAAAAGETTQLVLDVQGMH